MKIDQRDIKNLSDDDVRRYLANISRQCVENAWGPGSFEWAFGEALHEALQQRRAHLQLSESHLLAAPLQREE